MALKLAHDTFFAFLIAEEEDKKDTLERIEQSPNTTGRERASEPIFSRRKLVTDSEACDLHIDSGLEERFIKLKRPRHREAEHLINDCLFGQYNFDDFHHHFGMTRSQVEELSQELHPFYHIERESKLPLLNIILMSLWVLCCQESYQVISERFHSCKSVICTSLHKFCSLVSENLEYKICWPRGAAIMDTVKGFEDAGFPGTLGAMQACPIAIQKPKDVEDADLYMDSNNRFSTALLAVCDHTGKFTYINVGHPGNMVGGEVFQKTELYETLKSNPQTLFPFEFQMLGEVYPYHITSDVSFPHSEWVVTPFEDSGNLSVEKKLFNSRHVAALLTVSKAFVVLKKKFCRLKMLPMHRLSQCSIAVKCCCILHNITIDRKSLDSAEDLEGMLPPSVKLGKEHTSTLQAERKCCAITKFLSLQR